MRVKIKIIIVSASYFLYLFIVGIQQVLPSKYTYVKYITRDGERSDLILRH